MSADRIPLQQRAIGRWQTILPQLGIDAKFLKRKNGPCPMCGGKDRWRFTDLNGKGTWYCNHCGSGNGIALALKFTGLPFKELAEKIERIIGDAPAVQPVRSAERTDEQRRAGLNHLWQTSTAIRPDDPVDKWLNARGVGLSAYPKCLRCCMDVRHSGPPVSFHPAMLAIVADPIGKPATIHKTYLARDRGKAGVDRARMFCPGNRPAGGAVRLAEPQDVLGIAEGIETSLAAARLFDVPVWAALDASGIEKFEPPPEVQRLIIFGDNDVNGRGRQAAYTLAARMEGLEVELQLPDRPGMDWNDVLLKE
jgi:putative DNA primase/helicase